MAALRRSGISAPTQGAHLLRHSAATRLLREGVSLSAIGALLRHSSIETTTLYAKVDLDLLRQVAMPWPEVQPC
jgi:integrase/recombinase XerD